MLRLRASFVLPLVLATTPLPGQCTTQALSLGGVPGASYVVGATAAWDADGAGPAQAVPVIAGPFTVAGTAIVNGIAWYDAAANDWVAFGTGVASGSGAAGWSLGGVSALLPLPNGDLVAGGSFTAAGGTPAANVAVWTSGAWAPLGGGINGGVSSLALLPTGEIVAGGTFTTAGGSPASNIAVWNGTTWSALGGGLPWAVWEVAVMTNGAIAAGGPSGAKIWNGAWTDLSNQPVYAMSPAPGGGLIWSSRYYTWNPYPPPWGSTVEVPFVAQTIGTVTTYLLTGVASRALEWLPNGDLLTAFGNAVQRWDGALWSPFTSNVHGTVLGLTRLPNGELIAGGWLEHAGSVAVKYVAAWDGQAWRPLGTGFDQMASAIAERPNGEIVVGGAFNFAGVPGACVAQWNGSQWSALGSGVFTAFASALIVRQVVTLPGGDLVAAGSFVSVGGVAAANIARWDGAAWWPLGSGVNGGVGAALVRADGQLVVGGNAVARWDGTTWWPYGAGSDGYVTALAEAPNGDLVAAGGFSTMGGVAASNIARWTGAGWQPLGSGVNDNVFCVAFLPDGDVVAGGSFTSAGGNPANCIARWDGSSWSPMGAGFNSVVTALLVLPDGDVVASGGFTSAGGTPVNRLARWNGASWAPFGGSGLDDLAYAMQLLSTGELALAGRFTVADGIAAGSVAKLATTCPAGAVATGAGCTGAGGPNQLSALSLPWIGSTFRARASGLAPISLALAVFGFGAVAVPLPAILPQGVPGCSLLVTPDLIDVLVAAAGSATTQLPIPSAAALVGLALHHQLVAIEVDASANFVAATSTNGLSLTLGAW